VPSVPKGHESGIKGGKFYPKKWERWSTISPSTDLRWVSHRRRSGSLCGCDIHKKAFGVENVIAAQNVIAAALPQALRYLSLSLPAPCPETLDCGELGSSWRRGVD
jgi:hypothetical protein